MRRAMAGRERAAGFTLLEVMISLVILSIGKEVHG